MTLLTALAAHLRFALSGLHLSGATGAVTPLNVFVGDLPAKTTTDKPFPALILVPIEGHHTTDGEVRTTIAVIASLIGNDEDGINGAETVETDLAVLLSNLCRCLLSCAEGSPLQDRFVLLPDDKGRLLAWEKAEGQARPYCQTVITTHWSQRGWE